MSTGSGPIEGAALQQTFDVAAPGDFVTFYYNVLTNESVPESVSTDFIWWNLDRPVGADTSGVVAHVNETGFSSSGAASAGSSSNGGGALTVSGASSERWSSCSPGPSVVVGAGIYRD